MSRRLMVALAVLAMGIACASPSERAMERFEEEDREQDAALESAARRIAARHGEAGAEIYFTQETSYGLAIEETGLAVNPTIDDTLSVVAYCMSGEFTIEGEPASRICTIVDLHGQMLAVGKA